MMMIKDILKNETISTSSSIFKITSFNKVKVMICLYMML